MHVFTDQSVITSYSIHYTKLYEPQSYDVGSVDVEAQNMVLIRILRMASEDIRYNYGDGPFNLHLSYSKETTINDTINKKTTAEVLVYDKTGYVITSYSIHYTKLYDIINTTYNFITHTR